jgi:hypothetical protein
MSPVLQAFELLGRAIFSGQYLLYVLLAPVLLACGVKFNQKLQALNWRWLEWSPFHVRSNVVLLPIKLKWAWAPYALALAFVMPFLALLEEWIFRAGTTNWVRGLLIGTLAFGLCHLFSFVSVRMVVYLTLVGALFVQVYLAAGIIAVFVLHATYNLTALGMTVATRKRGLVT